jgi:hypothetical protein
LPFNKPHLFVRNAIEELAAFLGATTISYSHQVPEGWKQILT